MGSERSALERSKLIGWRALAFVGWVLVSLVLGVAAPASADWNVYMSGGLGYSVMDGSAKGSVQDNIIGVRDIKGSDTDVSPILAGAVGLSSPMDELLPLQWRLPDWRVRAELEAVGLREYELSTDPITVGVNQTGKVRSKIESWSFMTNFFLDLPMGGLYRPISWTSARLFGRWRLQTLKHVLDRTTFDVGAGVGVAHLDLKTEESATRGKNDEYNFAWQAGAGFGYQLTERVNLNAGYRYIDTGTVKAGLEGGGVSEDAHIKLDTEIHEARASVRVDFYGFASPWR
jgi:hypothetical protein